MTGVAAGAAQGGNATFAYDPLDNIRFADQGTRQYRYTYSPTSSDQNGNWIVDVSKAQASDSPLARGAMALGHEAKHDLDKIAHGVANTEGVVRERETAAYRIQAVIGRSAGFVMKQKDIQAGIDGSVLTWKEREEIRLNKASGGSQ